MTTNHDCMLCALLSADGVQCAAHEHVLSRVERTLDAQLAAGVERVHEANRAEHARRYLEAREGFRERPTARPPAPFEVQHRDALLRQADELDRQAEQCRASAKALRLAAFRVSHPARR